jgi:hypothetical protein
MNVGINGGDGTTSGSNTNGPGGGISLSNFFNTYVNDGGVTGANTLPRELQFFYQGYDGNSIGYGKGGNGGYTNSNEGGGTIPNGGKGGYVRVYFVI